MPFIIPTPEVDPGATFSDLENELYARGYDHLAQDAAGRARAQRWINQAYLEAALDENWLFRRAYNYGTPPLTISNLGDIENVVLDDAGFTFLYETTFDDWAAAGSPTTGAAYYWFRDANRVQTWPGRSTAIYVNHFAVPSALVLPTDTTVIPLRYADVIVDGAVRRAAKDRDNRDAAVFAEEERQRGLALMRRTMLVVPTRMRENPDTHGDS